MAERFSKEEFFRANGFSRQFLYKKKKSSIKREEIEESTILKVKEVRKKHRRMGSRTMYHQLKIDYMGINKFEKIVSKNGLTIQQKRKRIITTDGFYEKCDTNLINGLTLNNINQVIAGDITYLILKDKTYYIFTLKDMYSKRIIGLYGSDNMLAMNAIMTLKQAIKLRGVEINNCIHHSDAGSQYKSNEYKNMLIKHQIKMSKAENCLQNGMSEQLNGVLKNDYIIKDIKNLADLNKQLKEIKRLFNEERPVKELNYKTPVEFEKWLHTTNNPPKMKLYDFTNEIRGTLRRHNNKKSLVN
ncbi:IS3 family transposase [Flavobacterium branchiophilum]|uniref:IS3 family transposase n=1 Tax=Flavobacterium branchiophilum TaxID=55197 RepID=UPI001FAFAE1B|nr:IS3 family transposase [Flavobacterium branchiophilum]